MKASLIVAAFIAGLFVGIGMSGRAQSYIVASGLVAHLDGSSHCNNRFTPGLGYEHPLSKSVRLSIGAYSNSNCRWSTYAAGAWLPLGAGSWKFGSITGVVSGYSAPILPVGGLIAAYEPAGKVGFNVIFIPPAGDSGGGVLWGQIKWRF